RAQIALISLWLDHRVAIGFEFSVATNETHIENVLVTIARVGAQCADDAADVHVSVVSSLAGQGMQPLLAWRKHKEENCVLGRVDQRTQRVHVAAVGRSSELNRKACAADR